MKFHTESIKSYFSGAKFNKNKAKIFIIIAVVCYVVLGIFNIYQYSLIQRTVPVVAARGRLYKNQQLVYYGPNDPRNNIAPYNMTYKEYQRYGYVSKDGKVLNKLIPWDKEGKNISLLCGKTPVYTAYTKEDGEFLRWDQLVNTYVDNSRLILYKYPGKNIVELDISSSNLSAFKKTLRVGDKINISCTFDSEDTINITSTDSKKKNVEIKTMVVNDLFVGVEIADILNSAGESLLDYYSYLNNLTVQQRQAIEATDEYSKKIKVQTLFLALTPQEEKDYRTYMKKEGVKFYISMPQIDE